MTHYLTIHELLSVHNINLTGLFKLKILIAGL